MSQSEIKIKQTKVLKYPAHFMWAEILLNNINFSLIKFRIFIALF